MGQASSTVIGKVHCYRSEAGEQSLCPMFRSFAVRCGLDRSEPKHIMCYDAGHRLDAQSVTDQAQMAAGAHRNRCSSLLSHL